MSWRSWLLLVVVGVTMSAAAQESAPELHAEYERAGMPTPYWVLDLRADGSGTYRATAVTSAGEQKIERAVTVQAETMKKIFGLLASSKGMKPCETSIRNLANMGRKTLRYKGPDGVAECTFNYTENKSLASAMTALQGIALTLEEGRKLEYLHRFDRLGLDAEMQSLEKAASSGQAVDLSAIAATLHSLAVDESLMERVRTRAAKMLQDAGVLKIS